MPVKMRGYKRVRGIAFKGLLLLLFLLMMGSTLGRKGSSRILGNKKNKNKKNSSRTRMSKIDKKILFESRRQAKRAATMENNGTEISWRDLKQREKLLRSTSEAFGNGGNFTDLDPLHDWGIEQSVIDSLKRAGLIHDEATPPPVNTSSEAYECAWPVEISFQNSNKLYPDKNVIYQVMYLRSLSPKRLYRISGRFPNVRYFSYISYNVNQGIPISGLADFDVVSKPGSLNLFSSLEVGPSGNYELYVTKYGLDGYTNEIRGAPYDYTGKYTDEITSVIILRLYLPKNMDAFGMVNPPILEARTAYPNYKKGRPSRYVIVPECSDTVKAMSQSVMNVAIDRIQERGSECQSRLLRDDNFAIYQDTSAIYNNGHAGYVFSCKPTGSNVYAKISGHLPKTANTFTDRIKIADIHNYDVRYLSFQVGGRDTLMPTVSGLYDTEIYNFYKNLDPNWDTDGNRQYSIVVGESSNNNACGLKDSQTMFMSSYQVNVFTGPEWFLFYRQVLSEYQLLGESDTSIVYAKTLCVDQGKCNDPSFIQNIMGDYYPKVTYYTCNNGVATRVYS